MPLTDKDNEFVLELIITLNTASFQIVLGCHEAIFVQKYGSML